MFVQQGLSHSVNRATTFVKPGIKSLKDLISPLSFGGSIFSMALTFSGSGFTPLEKKHSPKLHFLFTKNTCFWVQSKSCILNYSHYFQESVFLLTSSFSSNYKIIVVKKHEVHVQEVVLIQHLILTVQFLLP